MSAARHLQIVVNAETGEVVPPPDCAGCRRLADEISGAQRDLRGWAIRYRELQRDKAVEAREHPLWPVAHMLFKAWRVRCNHPRSPWTEDRFWTIAPFLTGGRYGDTLEARVRLCARAIAGAGFDAFETTRRNGTVKRFDEFDRVFGGADKFEDFCNRAPVGWTPTLSPALMEQIELAEARLARLKAAS